MMRAEKYLALEDTSKGFVVPVHKENQILIVLELSRYFGRAKDLPGVKELFQRGGGLLFDLVPLT